MFSLLSDCLEREDGKLIAFLIQCLAHNSSIVIHFMILMHHYCSELRLHCGGIFNIYVSRVSFTFHSPGERGIWNWLQRDISRMRWLQEGRDAGQLQRPQHICGFWLPSLLVSKDNCHSLFWVSRARILHLWQRLLQPTSSARSPPSLPNSQLTLGVE